MTVRAIYENGVFRPTVPVNLPDKSEVEVLLPEDLSNQQENLDKLYSIMAECYDSGEHDVAERHNEHQP
jgi:predicted DNA-binding antitoxin AbrB/MazE fold protein